MILNKLSTNVSKKINVKLEDINPDNYIDSVFNSLYGIIGTKDEFISVETFC